MWRNPATGQQTPIPYHATKDIGTGLLVRILKQLGVERDRSDGA